MTQENIRLLINTFAQAFLAWCAVVAALVVLAFISSLFMKKPLRCLYSHRFKTKIGGGNKVLTNYCTRCGTMAGKNDTQPDRIR